MHILLLVIIPIIVVLAFVSHIDNKYKNYGSRQDEKAIEIAVLIICSTINVFLFEIFNSAVLLLIILVSSAFIALYCKYLYRKKEFEKYQNELKQTFQERQQQTNFEDLLDNIDNMEGVAFENFLINHLLPNEGYANISPTSTTGDYGVDIIATKNDIKCAIQCKRYNNKVSVDAIQEVVAGRKHYRCDKAMVITNNYYTNNAKELAEDNKVEILDRDDLIRMIKRYKF